MLNPLRSLGQRWIFIKQYFETDEVKKIYACLEVSHFGDFVYDRDIRTGINPKGKKELTRSSKSRSNETKVSAVFCTFDSSDVGFTRYILHVN
jgi:hypothetical protein